MRWPWSRSAPAAQPAPVAPLEPVALASTPLAVPAGPGSFTPTAPPTADPTKPAGGDGVSIYGGFLVTGESDRRLQGREKWVTYDNAVLNVAIIGSAVNVWTQLGGSAKWTSEPNKRGGDDAKRGADIVTEGLFDASMSTPWCQVVRRQLMKKFRGFALHEAVGRRRNDGLWVIDELADRPQWTVSRWNKPDEQHSWVGIEQQSRNGKDYYIERDRLFYSVENTLSPSPDGIGILRMLAEPVRVLELYQQWEGIGFQTDLRGMPVGRAPLQKLIDQARAEGAQTPDDIKRYVQAETAFLSSFLTGHNKTPDQGMMLDSATYTSKDTGQSPSSIYEWAFDLVKGASSSMPEIGTAIGRLTRDIARIMCAEWLMLGGEDSGGAYSMHEDKTAMFALIVNSALSDIAADARRDLAMRLIALNGLDPETCTPTLVPEPIAATSAETACRSLQALGAAALRPGDPAINVIRGRLDLPPEIEIDEAEAMLGGPGQQLPPNDEDETSEDPEPSDEEEPDQGPAADDVPQDDAVDNKGNDEGEIDDVLAWLDAHQPVGKSAQFDEHKHPRAKDGKFGHGVGDVDAALRDRAFVGAHADRLDRAASAARDKFSRLERVTSPERVNSAADAVIRNEAQRILEGHAETAAPADATEQEEIADALAAGHLDTSSRDVVDRHYAALDKIRGDLGGHAAALHTANGKASRALAAVHALEGDKDEPSGAISTDTHDLPGELAISQQQLRGALGHHDEISYDHDAIAVTSGTPGYAAEVKARTAAAQAELESLHERQTAAIGALRTSGKTANKSTRQAERALPNDDQLEAAVRAKFAGHERWDQSEDGGESWPDDAEDGKYRDPKVQQQYERAIRASDAFREQQSARLDDATLSLDDAQDELVHAHKQTARAIRQLARHSRRPAKLAM